MNKTIYTILGTSHRLSVSTKEYTGTIEDLKREFSYIPTVKVKNFRSINTLLNAINRHYNGREDEYTYRHYTLKE